LNKGNKQYVASQRNAARAARQPKPKRNWRRFQSQKSTSKKKGEVNTAEQGDTANIKQNTTNAGFFKGRRVK